MTTHDNLEQISNEAAAWVLELQSENISARERERFAHWLRESPANVREYLDLAGLWSELEGIDTGQEIDVDALLSATNVIHLEKSNCSDDHNPTRRPHRAWRYFAAAATVIIALVTGGRLLWPPAAPDMEVVSTRIGEQRSIALADGSLVYLNTQTSLSINLDDRQRRVELMAGEALFTVAKDPTRPFIVIAGKTQVRAVGTQFNVRREQDVETVTVVEGKVALSETRSGAQHSPPTQAATTDAQTQGQAGATRSLQTGIELTPGKQAKIWNSLTPIETTDVKTEKIVAWTKRRLIFDGEMLGEIVEEFNRYNLNRLEVTDAELRSIRLSGVFDANDPSSLLTFLTSTEQVKIQRRADGTQLIRPE